MRCRAASLASFTLCAERVSGTTDGKNVLLRESLRVIQFDSVLHSDSQTVTCDDPKCSDNDVIM